MMMSSSRFLLRFPKRGQACQGLFTNVAKSSYSRAFPASAVMAVRHFRNEPGNEHSDNNSHSAMPVSADNRNDLNMLKEGIEAFYRLFLLAKLYSNNVTKSISLEEGKLLRQWKESFQLKTHLSYLVRNLPNREFQEPLAVKKGTPLLGNETNFNPKEEVLVVSEEIQSWNQTFANEKVLDSEQFKLWTSLLHLATKDVIPSRINIADAKAARHKELKEIVNESVQGDAFSGYPDPMLMMRRPLMLGFYKAFIEAIQLGWGNSAGRRAFCYLLHAAADICKFHARDLHKQGELADTYIEFWPRNVGGEGQRNSENCACAIRHVPDAQSQEEMALRLESEWKYTTENSWRYRQQTPDVDLIVTSSPLNELDEKQIGYLTVEIKSSRVEQADMNQVFTQALKGLIYSKQSAGVLMSPQNATFIHILAEGGFIKRKMKTYNLVHETDFTSRYGAKDKKIDHEAFKDLFKDLVLYLWNTYYK